VYVIDGIEKVTFAKSIKLLDASRIKDMQASRLEIYRENNYLLLDSVGSLKDYVLG
jgi:hypothetical protein